MNFRLTALLSGAALALATAMAGAGVASAQQACPPGQLCPPPIPIPQLPQIPGLPPLPGQQPQGEPQPQPGQPPPGQPPPQQPPVYNPQPPYGQPQPGPYGAPPYGQPPYGYPGYGYPPGPQHHKRSTLEIGYLYGTSIAWGIGTGAWLDAEAETSNPGVALIMPALFGAVAPVGVFIADYASHDLPEGFPAALATGMWLGAGLGAGIWTVGSAVGDTNVWSFAALGRAAFVGSVAGGTIGGLLGGLMDVSPKTSMFTLSASAWGAGVGFAFGGAASQGNWRRANDAVTVGGLIGYGVGLLGSSGASIAWTPSWAQIGAMWAGYGIGAAATTPIYLVYLAVDADPRTGLIAQGIGGLLGIGIGAFLAPPNRKGPNYASNETGPEKFEFAKLLGIAPTPMGEEGLGLTATGLLW